jgi:hypothetical protein
MPGLVPVGGGMTIQRIVAASNVTAFGAAAQVYPPASGLLALETSGAAGRGIRVDEV